MPDQAGTLERLAVQLGRAVGQLAVNLDDGHALETFAALGVRFPAGFLNEQAITPARSTAAGAADAVDSATAVLADTIRTGTPAAIVAAGTALLTGVGSTFTAVDALGDQIRRHGAALPGIDQQQVDELTSGLRRKLFDQVLVAAADRASPVTAAFLLLTGIIDRVHHAGDPANPAKPEYEEVRVRFDQLIPLLTDPAGRLRARYGWGDPASDGVALLNGLHDALALMGLPALLTPEAAAPPRLRSLDFELTPANGGLDVSLPAALSDHTDVTSKLGKPGWKLAIKADWDSAAGSSVEMRAPLTITGARGDSAQVVLSATPETPIVLLGQAGGSRLEVAKLELGASVEFDDAGATPVLGGRLISGKLVIDTSQADGFVAKVFSGVTLEAGFETGFRFDPGQGLQFAGTGGIEIELPVHAELGPAEVHAVHLAARFGGGRVPIELSTDFSVRLGPIEASVERVGLLAELSFPDGGGNLGPARLDFAFKPPGGAGLTVNAGVVTGGGFLAFDPDRGEYGGAGSSRRGCPTSATGSRC
jgi:hypothetical protein